MEIATTEEKILKVCLKDFSQITTVSFLAEQIGMTRVGIWKALKRMELKSLVVLSPIKDGKTSTYIIKLNWNNFILEKILNTALTRDALAQIRWVENFKELEDKVDFLILYGSILNNHKEANDIDLLSVVSKKGNFIIIEEKINKIQISQDKKIHIINFTREELKAELKKPNRAFVDAFKKGIILFGQESFINFSRGLKI